MINSTSSHKSVNGNGFSYIGFLYDKEIFDARSCFSFILVIFHCAYAASTILQLPVQNLISYLNLAQPFSYKKRDVFGGLCDSNVCPCAVAH